MLEALWTKRALLVSGKGGVGKSTLAATLARAAVRAGHTVLLAEVTPSLEGPSVLGPLVGARGAGTEVTPVEPGLSFLRISASAGHRRFLEDVLPLRLMADAALRSRALRRFLEAGPSLRELGLMYQMLDLVRKTGPNGRFLYPLCVMDLPATGHALAMASLPRAILSLLPGGPIGRAVREGLELLQDPVRTAVLLATLPEPLPVSEALQLASEVRRLGLPLAAALLNRMPENPFPTPASRAALNTLLAAHGPHEGSRALYRLEVAETSRARLEQGVAAPLLSLPDLLASGPALVDQLASALLPLNARLSQKEAP
ncbi:ArsA-related P-loop ATPase [Stigmatella aurantiaca]|uniref:arsenite-transporting ATPase n=1 Tax=Stigmatella aurantiaca (strain DW4/3-1) TaxID=378806 RepID=E3FQA0_STIAD|nr:ArsA-related P-loop ATPase [Stigmatella aurantiaca]ADO68210.1 Anion-transporting ATPase family protein [Stigmatella aurantiaca DW4/3-1]